MISERWQQEVAGTVYEAVNADTDKIEARKRAKNKQLGHEEGKIASVSQNIFNAMYFLKRLVKPEEYLGRKVLSRGGRGYAINSGLWLGKADCNISESSVNI